MNRSAVAVFFLLVISACAPEQTANAPAQPAASPAASPIASPSAPPAAPAAVTTDRSSYALEHGPYGPETTIRSTFTAPPDTTVYLANCNGAINTGLQKLVDGRWTDVWAVEMNGCASTPIVIAPSGQYAATMTVDSAAEAFVDSRRREDRIESGTYRVIWRGLFSTYDLRANPPGEELPVDLRVSAPIAVSAAPPFDPARPSPAQRPAEVVAIEPEHGSRTGANAKITARLSFTRARILIAGTPRLYVDGEDVTERASIVMTESAPPASAVIEYQPEVWGAGLHQVRVVFLNRDGRTHWYAWSFTVE